MHRPLPWCAGPKLKPFTFKTATPQVTFLRLLGSGLHGHVFKARLDGVIYAIKLFKFVKIIDYWPKTKSCAPVDIHTVTNHNEPFYAECRAFGRLQETGHEDIAVKCYGYFMLESSAEDDISSGFGISEWDRGREHLGKPIRAIVKEYIDCDLRYTPNMIPSMMQSLLDINSLGIEVVDVKPDAYVHGTLVDFSSSRTVPHFMLEIGPGFYQRKYIGDRAYYDFNAFDVNIIGAWNRDPANQHRKPIELRFNPNLAYCKHLRKRPRSQYAERHVAIAMLYDWRKHPSLPPKRRRKTDGFLTRGTRSFERNWRVAKKMNENAKSK